MLKLRDGIIELYKKVATSIPPDVENSLKNALTLESPDSRAFNSLSIILENITKARKTNKPVCQDTGVPVFMIKLPNGISQKDINEIVREATAYATVKVPLRANAVDIMEDKNSGNNTGEGFPVIYYEESAGSSLVIDLMLKGAGCENAGLTYKLPDLDLKAERDLDGVRKCIIDSVHKAQGKACPPYILGVGIGATKDQVAVLAKKQLFKKITETNPVPQLRELEERLFQEINRLGIGPIGLGGASTLLGVRIAANHRHPASFFVDISFSCWATRRGRLIWS